MELSGSAGALVLFGRPPLPKHATSLGKEEARFRQRARLDARAFFETPPTALLSMTIPLSACLVVLRSR